MPYNNALHIAAEAGNIVKVRSIVNKHDVNARGEVGTTALFLAAQEGHGDIVDLLVELHADVNIPDWEGWTALTQAIVYGHTEVALSLLKVPTINVNHVNDDGWGALLLACSNDDTKVALALISTTDVDVNRAEKDGCTPLIVSCALGHIDVTRALLGIRGINVDHANHDGQKAIDVAKTEVSTTP